jgi:hypothetical protein
MKTSSTIKSDSKRINCIALFEVEAIDTSCLFVTKGFGYGSYSNLASIKKFASPEKDVQVEFIKMLNKEI